MKLYIKPGACSMASHIILAEMDADYVVEQVDTANGETASGANYREINPKGKVPALEVDGEILTEGPAILQFLGDRSANLDLAPSSGSMARARLSLLRTPMPLWWRTGRILPGSPWRAGPLLGHLSSVSARDLRYSVF